MSWKRAFWNNWEGLNMTERKMVPMESLIKSISMGPFGSDVKVEYMRDDGVPIIDGSNLTGIKMNWDNYRYLDKERAEKLKSYRIPVIRKR